MANEMRGDVKNLAAYAAAVEQFIKKLDIFIKESVNNINKMKQRHQKMGASWKDESYTKFSAVMAQSIKEAAKELTELQNIKNQLIKQLKLLK